jgi:hypothetical protein
MGSSKPKHQKSGSQDRQVKVRRVCLSDSLKPSAARCYSPKGQGRPRRAGRARSLAARDPRGKAPAHQFSQPLVPCVVGHERGWADTRAEPHTCLRASGNAPSSGNTAAPQPQHLQGCQQSEIDQSGHGIDQLLLVSASGSMIASASQPASMPSSAAAAATSDRLPSR